MQEQGSMVSTNHITASSARFIPMGFHKRDVTPVQKKTQWNYVCFEFAHQLQIVHTRELELTDVNQTSQHRGG